MKNLSLLGYYIMERRLISKRVGAKLSKIEDCFLTEIVRSIQNKLRRRNRRHLKINQPAATYVVKHSKVGER